MTPPDTAAADRADRPRTALTTLLTLNQHVRDERAAILRGSGVTPQQYAVLKALEGAGDAGLPTLAIAGRLLERAPGVTRLVDRLEKRGLAERIRGNDRRQVLCRLTGNGKALLLELEGRIDGFGDRVFACLNHNEVNVLLHLMRRVAVQLRR